MVGRIASKAASHRADKRTDDKQNKQMMDGAADRRTAEKSHTMHPPLASVCISASLNNRSLHFSTKDFFCFFQWLNFAYFHSK